MESLIKDFTVSLKLKSSNLWVDGPMSMIGLCFLHTTGCVTQYRLESNRKPLYCPINISYVWSQIDSGAGWLSTACVINYSHNYLSVDDAVKHPAVASLQCISVHKMDDVQTNSIMPVFHNLKCKMLDIVDKKINK